MRFPLFRGLLGHRVCLIDRATQARFSAIRTLEQLKTINPDQLSRQIIEAERSGDTVSARERFGTPGMVARLSDHLDFGV